jgi:hypothetical protein
MFGEWTARVDWLDIHMFHQPSWVGRESPTMDPMGSWAWAEPANSPARASAKIL